MEQELKKYFKEVEDPRSKRNQKHPFMMLIGTTLMSYLSGIDSYSGIADFVDSHYDELKFYFEFPHGVPSHDTYRSVWDAISPKQFISAFMLFTESLTVLRGVGEVISIDGKTIRNSGKEKALHIVSAWCEANQLTLAQERVNDKSNEITAIPKLLELLDIRDR